MNKVGEYSDALQKADAFVGTAGLGLSSSARTIHLNKDGLQVHNGPYADTQEQLGGYFMIKAADMDAAQDWAAKMPPPPAGPHRNPRSTAVLRIRNASAAAPACVP